MSDKQQEPVDLNHPATRIADEILALAGKANAAYDMGLIRRQPFLSRWIPVLDRRFNKYWPILAEIGHRAAELSQWPVTDEAIKAHLQKADTSAQPGTVSPADGRRPVITGVQMDSGDTLVTAEQVYALYMGTERMTIDKARILQHWWQGTARATIYAAQQKPDVPLRSKVQQTMGRLKGVKETIHGDHAMSGVIHGAANELTTRTTSVATLISEIPEIALAPRWRAVEEAHVKANPGAPLPDDITHLEIPSRGGRRYFGGHRLHVVRRRRAFTEHNAYRWPRLHRRFRCNSWDGSMQTEHQAVANRAPLPETLREGTRATDRRTRPDTVLLA